ncbi:flagellar hook protein FlgE [Sedimenticola hydrogenitrophicus]|uniref:flagellar hook protein FlgE n=1 Tax=Sedimenticola hydrogenitrophicus TaxID=2967975 RepID=UPI0023AFD571|nr:flagellar hook protein FlgE [Sedimenticola hydrogenitrophicus]
MPFRIALSGLDAASTDLQVTGHNIANAATNGFKQSRAEFADIYANSIQDVSTTSAGRGVRVSRVAQQFSQGNINFTASNLDLALNGEGFFTLADSAGNVSYSRAGAYTVDRDGYVVNHNSDRLQVFAPIGSSTTNFNTGSTTDLQLPTLSGAPSATTSANVAVNLDVSGTATAATTLFDPTIPTSYDSSTSTTVYDSLGSPHTMTMYYRESDTVANQWHVYTAVDGSIVTPTTNSTAAPSSATYPSATLNFNTSGALTTGSGSVSATGTVAYNAFPVAGAADLNLTFDYNNSTQFGSAFAVNNLTQDGFATGRLSGVDIDNSGVVFARFTNGQSSALGKVALAKFNNPQGLRQLGDTSWAETFTSGDVQMGEAGTTSFGLVQSGGLENSNVDIAEQLVNLITAQRNFQANAQVITTADTVTQTIINIR